MTTTEMIQTMTDRIVRDFHPLRLILFGSHARGDARPESDIICSLFYRTSRTNGWPQWRSAVPWRIYPCAKTLSSRLRKKSPAAAILLVRYYDQRCGRARCCMNEAEHHDGNPALVAVCP